MPNVLLLCTFTIVIMKRLFIATKLNPDDNTLRIYNSMRKVLGYSKIEWVDSDNFHLTFKYIGNTFEEKIPVIIDVIKNTVENYKVIKVELNKVRIFGSRYNPRVIWFGTSPNMQLENLGLDLIHNLDVAGFSKDAQNFIPHITVARINKITDKQLFNRDIEKMKDVFLQDVIVDKIVLFESILSPKGPRYDEIFSSSLSRL